MATLSPPTVTTTTHTPFLPKRPQLSSANFKKTVKNNDVFRYARWKILCNNNNNNNNANDDGLLFQNNNTPLQLDRRNVLIGLGGMYGTATLCGNAIAAPVAPNFEACTLTDAKFDHSVGDRCCPPAFGSKKLKDYNDFNPETIRVRRPAHKAMLDEEWLADYKRAIKIMKSLPMSDPRNFMQQARVHCAYCDGAYPVLDHSDQRYEVHGSWLFAPFHRWYLHFFEKIMGKLIEKEDFALPYWNWDHPDGMRIPEMFKDIDSPLYNPNRNLLHQKQIIDLAFNDKESGADIDDENQIKQNLLLVRKQMLYPTKPSVFFGTEYHARAEGDAEQILDGPGALEFSPHNNIHSWTGSSTVWGGQDMGAFWSAGRDPIFYCHHANVDRMWTIWRKDLPGSSRKDIHKSDYLNAYFIFYDENAKPVKVYVKDSFDTEKLGYKYEEQDLPWLTSTIVPRPTPKPKPKPPKDSPTGGPPMVALPKPLDEVIKTWVKRPRTSRSKADVEEEEEVLVISMDVIMSPQAIKYDVFINDGYDQKPGDKTDVKPQYAGSFTSLGHRGSKDMQPMTRKTQYRVALSTLLDDIGAADDDYIQVTLVPKVGAKNVVVNDIKIEFVSY